MAIESSNQPTSQLTSIDMSRIKRTAKANRKRDGSMTYMQHLDQAAKSLYGVRHFHEAQARFKRSYVPTHETLMTTMTPAQYYLRTVQEYYLKLLLFVETFLS